MNKIRLICVLLFILLYPLLVIAQSDFQSILRMAEQGNAEAQAYVGYCYLNGDGVVKNETTGFHWMLKAAKQGNAEGEAFVGQCYLRGIGIAKNESIGFQWTLKAAEQKNERALSIIASLYFNGIGTDKNEKKCFEWTLEAANHGIIDSYVQLGYLYNNGIGTIKNETEGFEWWLKAAEQGYVEAQFYTAICYRKGLGVVKNAKKAFEWYSKAAEQQYARAYNNLAYLYINGEGVSKDINKAFEMINRAIDIEPNKINYLATKGDLYAIIGDKDNALRMKQMIDAKDPNFLSLNKTDFLKHIQRWLGGGVDYDIPQMAVNNENTFAIIIAEEDYLREAKVPYALNDGKIFTEYCIRTLGLPEKNVKLVENATLNDIKYNVNWLKNVMKAYNGDAKVIFYYAGHGVPDEANKTAYLLPIDGYGSDVSTGYALSDLYAALSEMPAKSIAVFLDACFSGTKREGDMLTSARGIAIKVESEAPKGNMVVFSAAQGDETAYPLKEKEHGMFTYYLLKKLKDTKGDVTLGELGEFIKTQVSRQSIVANGKPQTPAINVSVSLGNSWKEWKLK